MQESGIEGPTHHPQRALYWQDWGEFLQHPAVGAVGVIDHGNGTGHVGIVVGQDDRGDIILLGGNQDNTVEYKAYPLEDFSSFQYPPGYFPLPQDFTLPTINAAQANICQ
jgi:uncharacterized protein (TIGR02594 family)